MVDFLHRAFDNCIDAAADLLNIALAAKLFFDDLVGGEEVLQLGGQLRVIVRQHCDVLVERFDLVTHPVRFLNQGRVLG